MGVSGGVDSSVSLALLKDQGYDVTGVFIKVWYPDWISSGCDWRAERRDAMRVCAHLNVPFITLDLEDTYKTEVVDYLIETYKTGQTPNPDIMCNRYVKFGSFWDFAKEQGADFIATGHYAQNQVLGTRGQVLGIAQDTDKDQTYFLYTLTQQDLKHVLFPIGNLEKKDVRKLAESYGLSTATKKDSQGLCFLGDVSIKDLLEHYVELKKGNVLNEQGDIVGEHDGALLYTHGQRHGFRLHNKETESVSQYVVSKNIDVNTITVSDKQNKKDAQDVRSLTLSDFTYTTSDKPKGTMSARVRYRGVLYPCKLKESHKKDCVEVIFETDISQEYPAPGQSVVLYKDNICLGGGIITE